MNLPESFLIVRCGTDWPAGRVWVMWSSPNRAEVRTVDFCSGYLLLPVSPNFAPTDILTIRVTPDTQSIQPPVTRY